MSYFNVFRDRMGVYSSNYDLFLALTNNKKASEALSKKPLKEVGRMSPSEFLGIGFTKIQSSKICAALELHKRLGNEIEAERPQIRSSQDAYHVLAPLVMDLPHEEFWILLLNRANRVIGKERISLGGVAGTVVDAKIIFKRALSRLACGIILCHNHPSGNLEPSRADLEITRKLKRAGETLEINILDHLIIAEKGYFSFADEGKM